MLHVPEIIVPYRISREFIRAHRQWNFVYSSGAFGSNGQGQSGQCRNEPNCYPVPVHFRFCRSNSDSWFTDAQFEPTTKGLIDKAIARIPRDAPIIVFPKIGRGFSQLDKRAPKTYEYLLCELQKIVYKNIKCDYYSLG